MAGNEKFGIAAYKASANDRIIPGIVGVALFYWLFEILLQLGAPTSNTVRDLLIGANAYETVRRVAVLVIFVIFASHFQYTVQRRKKAEIALIKAAEEESKLQTLAISVSRELNLGRLLKRILETACEILDADRGSIFMLDAKTGELHSLIALGVAEAGISFPKDHGLAGASFTTCRTIVTRDAYSEALFNPKVDQVTGYITRTVLCVPVLDKHGRPLGVIEIINKRNGYFTPDDERRLETFGAHVSVAIENAALFENVLNLKNYNERVLESLTNGVVGLDEQLNVVKCNAAALRIMELAEAGVMEQPVDRFFPEWVPTAARRVVDTGVPDLAMDVDLDLPSGNSLSVNLSAVPLTGGKGESIGAILVIEDITQEKRVKTTMARYMTKEIAEKLLENDGTLLGGVEQEATVLFSDIRGFTRMAEKMRPREAVSLLNEYFTLMVDIVFRRHGVLDKYIGDGLMAVFGAPVPTESDPDNAIRAAIDMMRALREFNRRRTAEGRPPLNIGIGINTDEIISGNIGSTKRMDYTVIGDGVNLAYRLEQANKFYSTNILMSEFTYRRAKGDYLTRKIDIIRVKGKDQPVSIYQVLDYHDEETFPNMDRVVELYGRGLECYEARDWNSSGDYFRRAVELNQGDYPTRLFLDRCRCYLSTPPADDWDGVGSLADDSGVTPA